MTDEKTFNINSSSLISAKPGIGLQEEADNWGILYNPETDYSFGVNPVSVFIWKQLETPHSLYQLVEKVNANCTGVPDKVEEDVIKFIGQLLEKGMANMENEVNDE